MTKRQNLIRALVWLGLRFPKKFIRELAKVEYGVAHYVRMLADERPEYKQQFYAYATEEKYHGRMLAALIDELPESKGGLGMKHMAYSCFAGRTRIEGVAKRYRVIRKILSNKTLNQYSFIDRLSIMSAFESIALTVYQEIVRQTKDPLKKVAFKIAKDEEGHKSYLTEILSSMGENLENAIKWEQRIIDSLPYAILDLPKLFLK